MSSVSNKNSVVSLRAYQGDAKTLLAFNLNEKNAANLAGFTIQCQPDGKSAFFIHNQLQFKGGEHARDPQEPPNSSINAPIHKFRWVHVPGSVHQGTKPFLGKYTYTVTPRYFDDQHTLLPIDKNKRVSVQVNVEPFQKGALEAGFARGFVQSQAFVHHFGRNAKIPGKQGELLFDTSEEAGVNDLGEHFTFEDQYQWLGFTARQKVFDILNQAVKDKGIQVDMFAYDLNEPDVMKLLLKLAQQGRIRMILDNAGLHHSVKSPKAEDQFEELFHKAAKKDAAILRGKFNRFAHDKVIILSKTGASSKKPFKVLTGSTNFSITGVYVNSNHVLVSSDAVVAAKYSEVFEQAFQQKAKGKAFQDSPLAQSEFPFGSKTTPKMEISFAPHPQQTSDAILNALTKRVAEEGKKKTDGSVLFAVMQLSVGTGPVLPALQKLHENQKIFSFGISDSPKGIFLYKLGTTRGLLVTGKPTNTKLPPPFNQVPGLGVGHQVHHKFVVCGFNRSDAVVYCGSSNLASGGEQSNGDNLLAIHDSDVATVFAIEALALVDHFNFLDRFARAPKAPKNARKKAAPAVKQQAAAEAGWFLSTSDKWTKPYFDPKDLHFVDRELFA